MNKPIFYTKKLNWWDYLTLGSYTLLTLFIYFLPETSPGKKDWLFFYTIGTHMFIYFLNYKSLRKVNVWCIWFLFAIVHIVIANSLVDDPHLQMHRGPAAYGLKYTWLLLILFQVLRWISARTQGLELVAPSKSRTDIWDDRQITIMDFILFLIYFGLMIVIDIKLI